MKLVISNAHFHLDKCVGCKTCAHVCPTLAFTLPLDRPLEKGKIGPCVSQCPIGIDIEGFVSLIGQERYLDAYSLVLKNNPFPGITGRVCHHPCEENCNRGKFDEGISIQALERFVADRAMREGFEIPKTGVVKDAKIAIVGSGPAGLSCAYHLANLGYQPTVFEAEDRIGGMLRLGIPEYRLPKKVLDWEIEKIRSMGVEILTNRRLGGNLRIDELDNFDAAFIAIGFQKSHGLEIEGEDSEGVLSALGFLRNVNTGQEVSLGKRVAVIGGGNSAIDAARCALRLGCRPLLLYRRSVDEMPAIPSERQELEQENIEVSPLVVPKRIISKDGHIRRVECLRTRLGEIGEDGRRRPIPIEGSEFTVDVDNVIAAVGESPDFSGLAPFLDIKRNRVMVASDGVSVRQAIFAGGDIVTGAGTVSEAIASGMKAAMAIHRFLRNETNKENGVKPDVVGFEELNSDYFSPAEKIHLNRLDPAKAVRSFDEVRSGYGETEALGEARRCFGCGAPPQYNVEDCRGCSNCEQRCPASAITIEPREQPFTVGVNPDEFDREEILSICTNAKMHPKQIVCYCTNTTAGEIAAAILQGATTPEDISRTTGARTGCGVLCIQSIVRLLQAAGHAIVVGDTHQHYGKTRTVWEVDDATVNKYEEMGYRFQEDMRVLEGAFKKE
jgi:NADPH-dependent glutamate synthase beta subunit-like oxidoreductase/bacterioferritin-associated ferredoxin